MITDLNETIKLLLTKKGGLEPAEVDINFETPDREWSASLSRPTVNIYLYDIRENHQLRGTEWMVSKDSNGKATRRKTPNRANLSYLITVWANDVMDEHRLLWDVLLTLFGYPELPEDVITGQLVEHTCPIVTATAQPDGLFNNPADFWSALDNEIKPSINYVVTLPLDRDMTFTATTVRTKIIDVKPPGAEPERLIQISGTVYEAGKAARGLAGARVVAKEANLTTVIDEQGHYSFRNLSTGKHTFQVVVPGKKTRESSVSVPNDNYDLKV